MNRLLLAATVAALAASCHEPVVLAPVAEEGWASWQGASVELAPVPTAAVQNPAAEPSLERDPFVAFRAAVEPPPAMPGLLPNIDVASLRLTGFAGAPGDTRALVVASSGESQVLSRGDYLGRAEHLGAARGLHGDIAATRWLRWRVLRVRDGELVLGLQEPGPRREPAAVRVLTI